MLAVLAKVRGRMQNHRISAYASSCGSRAAVIVAPGAMSSGYHALAVEKGNRRVEATPRKATNPLGGHPDAGVTDTGAQVGAPTQQCQGDRSRWVDNYSVLGVVYLLKPLRLAESRKLPSTEYTEVVLKEACGVTRVKHRVAYPNFLDQDLYRNVSVGHPCIFYTPATRLPQK